MDTNLPDSLTRFRRALRRSDQEALDDLIAKGEKHLAAVMGPDCPSTLELVLVCLLLEEHKEVLRLRKMLEER